MSMNIEYTVSGVFNKLVNFECPKCKSPLSTALKDAGISDDCPHCSHKFISPGEEILQKVAAKAAKKQAIRTAREAAAAHLLKLKQAEKKQQEAKAIEQECAASLRRSPVAPSNSSDSIHCPRCGSNQIAANKQGFGVGNAVVGSLIFGPLGLIGGAIGAGKIKITCLKCGTVFGPGEGA